MFQNSSQSGPERITVPRTIIKASPDKDNKIKSIEKKIPNNDKSKEDFKEIIKDKLKEDSDLFEGKLESLPPETFEENSCKPKTPEEEVCETSEDSKHTGPEAPSTNL